MFREHRANVSLRADVEKKKEFWRKVVGFFFQKRPRKRCLHFFFNTCCVFCFRFPSIRIIPRLSSSSNAIRSFSSSFPVVPATMQLFETISGAFAAFLPASSSLPFSSFSSPSSSSSFPHTTDVNANVPASEEPQERRVFSRQEQLMKDHENRLIKFGLDWFHRYRRDPSSFSSEREENNGQEGCLVKSSAHDIRIQGFCDDDGGSAYIHYVKYSPSTLKDETEDGFTKTKMAPFLLLPGYGCGLGVFYASAPILADRLQTDVLAVDQFGCGLSTRPLWKGGFHLDDGQRSEDRSSSSSSSSPIDTMESLFVESLEAFRKALGEEKISLVGHSMGGYLASCYSLAYPERVEHLVLASPVGVPLSPSLVNHPSSTTSLPDSSSEENTQSSEQQKAAEGAEDGNKGSWMPLTVPTAADIKNSLRSVLANSVKNAWRQGYVRLMLLQHNCGFICCGPFVLTTRLSFV